PGDRDSDRRRALRDDTAGWSLLGYLHEIHTSRAAIELQVISPRSANPCRDRTRSRPPSPLSAAAGCAAPAPSRPAPPGLREAGDMPAGLRRVRRLSELFLWGRATR